MDIRVVERQNSVIQKRGCCFEKHGLYRHVLVIKMLWWGQTQKYP